MSEEIVRVSRVGRMPIPIPPGVTVSLSDKRVSVVGPGGALEHTLPESITIKQEDSQLFVERSNDERHSRALHGLTRALVNNMVVGTTQGFSKELEIVGVGYRATLRSPNQVELALGFSHPVVVDSPDGVTFEVPTPTRIVVKGADKAKVGQVAATIRRLRKPEPYKGKGIRYAGERILRKAGKAAK